VSPSATTPSHTDGEAFWQKVRALGLEGVVAKKRSGHYPPAAAAGSRRKPRLLALPARSRRSERRPSRVTAARHLPRRFAFLPQRRQNRSSPVANGL
jgi:hypothetical protein